MVQIVTAIDAMPKPMRARVEAAEQDRLPLLQPAWFREGVDTLIIGARQHGKTWNAMQWVLDRDTAEQRVLIVRDTSHARSLKRQHDLTADDPRIISWRQARNDHSRRHGVTYGIDGAEEMLAVILGLTALPAMLTIGTSAPEG